MTVLMLNGRRIAGVRGLPLIPVTPPAVAGNRTGDTITHTGATQWTRDGANIAGATAETYTLTVADEYKLIGSDTADPDVFALPALAAPTLGAALIGAPNVDDTLATSVTALTGYPRGRLGYQWRLDAVNEAGETRNGYKVPSGAVGQVPSVVVTASNPTGTDSETLTGAAISAASGVLTLTGDADPTLAINVSGVVDSDTQMPFLDIIKQSRPLFGDFATQDHDYLIANGHLDADGWPVSMPPAGIVQTVFDWSGAPEHNAYMAGTQWQVTWEGTGTVTMSGNLTTNSSTANSITFTVNDAGASGPLIGIGITATNAAPNNVRNIRCIRVDRQALYDAGQIFNPDFIDFLKDLRLIRFMDWGQTNNSPQTTWASRARYSDVTWASATGVPIPVMIALCNQLNSDMWLCIPHQATDDWVTQAARLVKHRLNPDLIVYDEYSNEFWNGIFEQAGYGRAQGRALWPGASGESDTVVQMSWYGYRAAQCFALWDAEYAGITARRRRVFGAQTDFDFINETTLDAPIWRDFGTGYVAPHLSGDHLAVTTYYGYDLLQDAGRRAAIAAAYPATSDDLIYNYLMDPASGILGIPQVRQALIQSNTIATTAGRNLSLIGYEGGTHILHFASGATSGSDEELAALQFHASEYSAEIHQILWDIWEDISDGPFMPFAAIGLWGQFGSWTLARSYGDYPIFAEQLRSLSLATPNWWGATGDYQHVEKLPVQSISYYAYGNSLNKHDTGLGAGTDDTDVPWWVDALADHVGLSLEAGGQFGNPVEWAAGPASPNWGWVGVDDSTTPTFDTADLDVIAITPNNFVQAEDPVTGNYNGSGQSASQLIQSMLDYLSDPARHPNARFVIYMGLPDADAYGTYPISGATYDTFLNDSISGAYVDWYVKLTNQLIADNPDLNIGLNPVAVIKALVTRDGPLSSMTFGDLYEDGAPHGRDEGYFLSGLIQYMYLYDRKPPLDYTPPGTISATITNNYAETVEFIWSAYQRYKFGDLI